MYYIVAEGTERIFTRPNFFDLESQRKKEGVGGLSVKLSGDQMPNDAHNDEYEEECEGVRHGLSSCRGYLPRVFAEGIVGKNSGKS